MFHKFSHEMIDELMVEVVEEEGTVEEIDSLLIDSGNSLELESICLLFELLWKVSPELLLPLLWLFLLINSFFSLSFLRAFFFFLSRMATSDLIFRYVFLNSESLSCNILILWSASFDSSIGSQKLYFDSGTKLWKDICVNEKGDRCSRAVNGECRSALWRPIRTLVKTINN